MIEGFCLSPQQVRLWSLQQEKSIYYAWCLIAIDGNLQVNSLERALQAILSQYDIYHMVFHKHPNMKQPFQVRNDGYLYFIRFIDLQQLTSAEKKNEIEKLSQEEITDPADLKKSPLIRLDLFRLAVQEYVLFVSLPSLCADKQTLCTLFCEIVRFYTLQKNSRHSHHAKETVQYIQFSEWQNSFLNDESSAMGKKYWYSKDVSRISKIPLSFEKRSNEEVFQSKLIVSFINEYWYAKIEEKSKEYNVSSDMLLLACWYALLFRLTRQNEIIIGIGVNGRIGEELIETPGPFTTYLPLRCSFAEEQSFERFLCQLSQEVCEATSWQHCFSWESYVDTCNACMPLLLPFGFDYLKYPESCCSEGLTFSLLNCRATIEPFRISISLLEQKDHFAIEFYYNPHFFSEEDIQYLATLFRRLLENALSFPKSSIGQLKLLSDSEYDQLITRSNNMVALDDPTKSRCIHELVAEQALSIPDCVAVTHEDHWLTYQQLDVHAELIAAALQAQGVGPEVLVGIYLERSLDLVIGLLAVLKAGGAYVPLDPLYPSERLSTLLSDALPAVVLTTSTLYPHLPPSSSRVLCLEKGQLVTSDQRLPVLPVTLNSSFQDAALPAYVIYTSGSTGQPKGVVVTHANVVRLLAATQSLYRFDQHDIWTLFHSFAFDFSVWELWGALAHGGRLVVVSSLVSRSPHSFYDLVCQEQVTILNQTPSAFYPFAWRDASLQAPLALRLVICGGEALDFRQLSCWMQQHDDQMPQLFNMYGITETTVHVTAYQLQVADVQEETGSLIGRPLVDLQVHLLDEQMYPVPPGVWGELYVEGAGLTRGYLHSPHLTAQRFVPHPWSQEPGMRLYRTGDLVRYLPDGNLEFLGRNDEQVKVRGFRVELGEIEAVLNQHPQVQTSAVILRETEQQDKQLVAYVVSKPGMALASSQELQGYLRKYLPAYMIPAWFEPLEQLPLTVQGKVDRKALPAVARKRQEGEAFREDGPRTPLEDLLVGVWQDLLEREQIGVHEDFFALGGHSLLATRLLVRLQALLHIEVPLRTFFEAPTVAKLSAQIEASGSVQKMQTSAILSVSRRQDLPLSFAQQRLWFLNQLEPENTAYNVPFAIHLTGILHISVLKRSLEEIMRRHEALRTNFEIKGEHAVQVIRWFSNLGWSYRDLSQSSVEKVEDEANKIIREQIQYTFNLRSGPLLCAMLLKLSKEEYVLLLMMPHIIWDGWSQGIFLRELAALYTAFLKQVPASLPELPIQYADFALWQRNWLQGSTLEALLAYWTHQLRDIPALLPLPTDYPRPIRQTYRGARYPFTLPPAFTEELRLFSRRQGGTVFMTLLTACQILLARYTGLEDIVVGSPIANRNRIELEGLIGCFVNTLVLRGDLTGDPTVRQLLQRTREMTLQAYAHQDLPLEKLVEELAPQRTLNYHPVFQVLFVLQNMPIESLELPGLQVQPYELESYTAKFDLGFFFQESQDGLRAVIEYSTDLFSATAIRRLSTHYQHLLQLMVHAPDQRIHQISFLTEEEREQLLHTWNATHTTQPAPLCLHELFEAQTQRIPDAVAVLSAQEQITYECLELVANKRARQLQQLGVTIEATVGLRVERSLALAVGVLAILKAGAAYVPIDPTYPQERQRFMLQDAQVAAVFTERSLLPTLPSTHAPVVCLDAEVVMYLGEENITTYEKKRERSEADQIELETQAYVLYTSGSTGYPKGVAMSHRAVSHLIQWQRSHSSCGVGSRTAQFASLSFDVSCQELFATWSAGGIVVLMDEATRHDPYEMQLFLQKEGIERLFLPVVALQQLADVEEMKEEGTLKLREIITAGEQLHLTPRLVDFFRQRPTCRLYNQYGPTESHVVATYELKGPATAWAAFPPIGRPIDNMEFYVLDAYGQPTPMGVVGELYIGGIALARGYHRQPALTAERFVPHPFSQHPGARLYKTGDLVRYLPGGILEFQGRCDTQVKIRGFRVELGEIEAALMQHPLVHTAVVLAQDNAVGHKNLVAYIYPTERTENLYQELRDFVQARLPEYMLPGNWVWLKTLPLTGSGKLDRQVLLLSEETDSSRETPFMAPSTLEELLLMQIWSEVLKVDRISIYDNFFSLGGDSLLAIRVVSRLREKFHIKLAVRNIFEAPTISQLAKIITKALSQVIDEELLSEALFEIENKIDMC